MGLIDFVKDAGEKLFGRGQAQATAMEAAADPANAAGVAGVEDMMSVDRRQPEGQYCTVVSGDTPSKISRQYCGDADKYMKIFEANKPMLGSPDRIYPGQKLRIPPQ
jgi:nucleoid-associated protein YgaU